MKAPHATTIATLLAVCITKVYGKRTIRRGLDEGSMSMFMPEFAKGKSGSSSKSGKACPNEADNSCLSDTRKASLLAKFGIQITNDNATGYDKISDVFIQSAGLAAPEGEGLTIDALEEFQADTLGVIYVVDISDFSCIEEIYALAATACDNNEDCTYFSVNEFYDKVGYLATLKFFSEESVAAQVDVTEFKEAESVVGFPAAPRRTQEFTAFIKSGEAAPRDFSEVVCDVPPFTQTELAFTCAFVAESLGRFFTNGCCGGDPPAFCQNFVAGFNEATGSSFEQDDYCSCPSLVTSDFVKYLIPSAECLLDLDPTGAKFQQCLTCISNVVTPFECTDFPSICEEDDAMNFISAMPCEGGVQTGDCVCDACGDVCGGTACKAEIQTTISCQLGSPATVVQNDAGDFVEAGSCLNSRTGPGDDRDYSCPSSE